MKMQDMNMTEQLAWHEIAGQERYRTKIDYIATAYAFSKPTQGTTQNLCRF